VSIHVVFVVFFLLCALPVAGGLGASAFDLLTIPVSDVWGLQRAATKAGLYFLGMVMALVVYRFLMLAL
jgi:hypothetical protein